MAVNQRARRSDQEWFNIITECRQSGLSDKNWCEIHDIPISSFHTALRRLRKKAYAVPNHSVNDINPLDFTARQEIVRIKFLRRKINPACCTLTKYMFEERNVRYSSQQDI